MRECHAESLGDDLRRGRGAQELTTPTGTRTGPAAELRGFGQGELAMSITAPIDWILPASSPSRGGSVTPPGTNTPRQVASSPPRPSSSRGVPYRRSRSPKPPYGAARDRIKRRKTIAASLRYGRLSIIPAVPWVRPSHGSETMPANGTTSSRLNSSAAS